MIDFVFSASRQPNGRLAGIVKRFLGPVLKECRERHGRWGSLASAYGHHETAPRGVAHGRSVVETERSAVVLNTHGTEGPIGKLSGKDWKTAFNGPFAIVEATEAGGRVVTDMMGWISLYVADRGTAARWVGSHPDILAEAASISHEVDPVSMAEFLTSQRITWPYTIYEEVRQLAPASEYTFQKGGRWRTPAAVYWQPRERAGYGSMEDAAIDLRDALISAVNRECSDQPEVGLLLSGGEDGRVVLGAIPEDVTVRTFTLAPFENREVRVARRIATAYGALHTYATRPELHDLDHLSVATKLVSSQHEVLDLHTFPYHETLGLNNVPVVLGGFSSDALLKGDNITRTARRFGPGYRATPKLPRLDGIAAEVMAEVLQRQQDHLDRIFEFRPLSGQEWFHLWPASMRTYIGNWHGNRRLFTSYEPFQDNRIVDIAAAIPQRWKIDRKVYHRAFRPLLAKSWHVPHSRNRLPYFGATANRVLRGPLGLVRRARDLALGERGTNQESWPRWERVANTNDVERSLSDLGPAAARVGELGNVGELVGNASTWPPLSRLALLQLKAILREV